MTTTELPITRLVRWFATRADTRNRPEGILTCAAFGCGREVLPGEGTWDSGLRHVTCSEDCFIQDQGDHF